MTTTPNFIGIELCGPKLRAATVDNEGVIRERREEPLDKNDLIAQIAQVVNDLRTVSNEIGSIGIAIPGLVNRQTDKIVASNYLPASVRENLHEEAMKATGLRVELVDGDFFAAVPVKADIYMLKHIIHDWYEDRCQKILRNIRENMADDSKVLIIEAVVPEGNEPHFSKIIDLEMLLSPGGVERTPSEYEKLLADSGMKLNRIIPTNGAMSIIEAVKA